MNKCLILIVLLVSMSCNKKLVPSNNLIRYEQKFNYNEIIGCLDRPAEYPEPHRWAMYHYGLQGLNIDLNAKLIYPKAALEKQLEGMVLVRFIVETDGYIYKTEVINSNFEIFEQAAQDAIKNLNQWIPALIDNKPVASMYKLPVYFKLPPD